MAIAQDAKVKVKVTSVQETRARSLVEDDVKEGLRTAMGMTTLRVTIELEGEAIAGATQYSQLRFTAADDKGNALKAQEAFIPRGKGFIPLDRSLMWLGRPAPADRIRLELNLDSSKREATRLATLEGSVKLLTGKPVDVLIGDLEKLVNKPLENPELAEAGIKATLAQFNTKGAGVGSYVKLKVAGKVEALAKVDVVDASGKSLSQGSGVSRGFAGGPSMYEVFGDAALPAGAKMKITLLTDLKEMEVPIKLKDVPLP
jgi:hypothetical protein